MKEMIRILQLGLGPIGLSISKQLLARKHANLVAAIDIAPDLQGKDIGQLVTNSPSHVIITSNLQNAIDEHHIDIAVVCSSSKASIVETQITPLLEAGIPVVTTCEELLFPWKTQPALAKRLDHKARQHHVAVLATGVNPGFLMDYLPTTLTAISENISHITVNRVQNASTRRPSFQQKIGVGLSQADFNKRKAAGTLRHVGLTESVHFIANNLGWQLSKVEETLAPVMINQKIHGVQQIIKGYIGSVEVIMLNFVAATEHQNEEDRIIISGNPDVNITFSPPINGDIATTSIAINAIPKTLNAKPGLQNMASVGTICYWS